MSDNTLQEIEKLLHSQGLDCALTPGSDDFSERLMVYFGLDEKMRQRILEITTQDKDLLQGAIGGKGGIFQGSEKIQFAVNFPFSTLDETAHDVRSLLSFLNRMMELPGLEVDESENRIYYRYVWFCRHSKENLQLTLSIIGAILIILDAYTGIIEPIADGRKTFDELLQDVMAATEKVMNPGGEKG